MLPNYFGSILDPIFLVLILVLVFFIQISIPIGISMGVNSRSIFNVDELSKRVDCGLALFQEWTVDHGSSKHGKRPLFHLTC